MIASLAFLAVPALAGPADGVRSLEWARPFALEVSETWSMRSDRPALTRGWMLELRVDPKLAAPFETLAPLLTVGEWPALRVNFDPVGGCAVIVIPETDLASSPVFWGPAGLPEQLAPGKARADRAAASAAGARPFGAEEIAAAVAAGGAPLAAHDLRDVYAVLEGRVAACEGAR